MPPASDPGGDARSAGGYTGGATPWRTASAQVLVGDLSRPVLSDEAQHHLRRVLRLEPGATVCAYDGVGSWTLGHLGDGAELEDCTPVGFSGPPTVTLTVGFAALKGSRNELVVQKLTEIGIDRIWVLRTRRSVVRWDSARAARHLGKLQRVAAEACAQCRRLRLPAIEVLDFADVTSPGG
ncbi:MAG: RsmE family RNA methyltransferase, partial [Microthrixaceae bacterium]